MTEQEKQELKQEIITQIESESQDVTELEQVSSLDGINTLPAMRGTTLVTAPVSLLGKPATDAAAQALAAKTQAEGAANSALAAAENANAKAREAAEAAQIMVATGHEAFLVTTGGGIRFETKVPKSDPMPENPTASDYQIRITIQGIVYINGRSAGYSQYRSSAYTVTYSNYALKYLIWDTAAADGAGDFVVRSSQEHTKLGATEYLLGIIRLPVGYDLLDDGGVLRLNCATYTINGVKYHNRYPATIGDRVTVLEREMQGKQSKLVSGTNIKTVNGKSLLGSGDIEIGGGGGEGYDLSPRYKNPPYPCDADKLRVLCIGNSFTADTLTYIGTLISNSSLRSDDLYIASFIKSSAEIDEWIVALKNAEGKASGGPWIDLNWQGDNITPIDNTLPFCDIIASQPWDVITVQQDSDNCYNYTTYRNLPELIRLIRELCPNKNVCLGWIMAWATAAHDTWQANADNARRMAAEYGIDIIVPSGTVVENIKTNLVGDSENVFTKYYSADKVHLRYGAAARYAVGCAFWETIIKPWSGISILGCPTNVDAGDAGVQVTDVNRLALQLCATAAVTDISGSTAIEIPTATTHPTAAEIAAAYAAQAQKPSQDPYAALRAMYIAADPRPASDPDRLRYNAKTGFYEMNRLVDITEGQMAAIFAYASAIELYRGTGGIDTYTRTLYPMRGAARYYVINNNYFYSGLGIESLQLTANKTISCISSQSATINYAFWRLPDLRYILDIINCHGGSFGAGCFDQCYSLEYIKLRGLEGSIYFKSCPKLNYESLRYLVTNAANTVAISVTVHATTYGYLTGTIEPTEQVGGTSAEWQQIVADATAKNISFATA